MQKLIEVNRIEETFRVVSDPIEAHVKTFRRFFQNIECSDTFLVVSDNVDEDRQMIGGMTINALLHRERAA